MRQALQVGVCWLWVAAAAAAAGPASVDLTTSATTVTANFSDTATLTAVVRDAANSPVANQMVTISASGSNNGIARRSGMTDATGSFVTTIKSNVAQRKLVTASTGLLTDYQSVDFVAGPPALGRCQVLASPKMGLVADGISTSLLTITAQDMFANPIADIPISLSVSGVENNLNIQNGNSSESGLFFSGLTSTHAELKTVSAQIGNLVVSTTVGFIGNSPNATFSQFTITPNTPLAADQNQAFKLQVLVRDDHNNAIPNYPVAFGIDGTTARFDAADGYSTSAGVFATSLRSATIGEKQIYVTAGEFSSTQNVTFTVGVPRSGTSSVVATPNSLVADNNAQATIVATVRDASGNPVPSAPVSLSVNGNRNTFSASTGTTDANGVFVATLSSSLAETKSVTMVSGTATSRGLVNFLPGSANQTLSRFTVSPNTSVPANNSALFTMTTYIVDDFSNPVRLYPITYASSGPNDTLTDADNLTSNAGVAYNTLRSTSVGISTITMSAGSLVKQANVTFTLGAMSTSVSHLTASPNTNVIADMNHPVTLSATLKDIVGHTLANQNITITSNGPNDVIATPVATSDANGMFTTTLLASKFGTKTIYLSNGNQRISTIAQFIAGPPDQNTSSVSLAPNNVIADNRSITSVEVDIFDGYQNPVRGVPVTLAVSDTNSAFGAVSGTTNVTGTFITTLRSNLATPKTVTTTFVGLTAQANITFVAGSPSALTSSLVVSPNTGLLANNSDTANISVTLKDAYGNVTPKIRVLLTGQAVGNTFAPATGLTDGNGMFTSSVKSSRSAAQKVTLSAGTATLNANVTFSPGPATQATSSIERSPYAGVTANGSAVSTVIASLYDQWNNPIANVAGSMSSSNANDLLSNPNGMTTSLGTYTTTVKSTQAGGRTITFVSGNVTLPITVTFVAGSPNAAFSAFVADMNTSAADNVSVVTLTTTLKDSFQNPISAAWVNFTATGARYLFSPSGMSTDTSGMAQSTFRSASSGVRVLKAQTGMFALTANITLTAGSPNSNTTKVTANPNANVKANGSSPSTLKAFVFDVFSNPVPNQSVTFTSNGNTDAIAAPTGVTDANGNYSTTLVSNDAGQKTITLTAGPAVATTRIIHVVPTASLETTPGTGLALREGVQAGRAPWVLLLADEHHPARVVAAHDKNMPSLSVWEMDAQGAMGRARRLPVPLYPSYVAAGDLDQDGQADVVVASSQSGKLWVALSTAADKALLNGQLTDLGEQPVKAVFVTDVRGRGEDEVAVLEGDGKALAFYTPQKDGSLISADRWPLAHAADAIALHRAKETGAAMVAIATQQGVQWRSRQGATANWRQQDAPAAPSSWLGFADLHGDGDSDLISLHTGERAISVWYGDQETLLLSSQRRVEVDPSIRVVRVEQALSDEEAPLTLVGADGMLWRGGLPAQRPELAASRWQRALGAERGLGIIDAGGQAPLFVTLPADATAPHAWAVCASDAVSGDDRLEALAR